MTLLDSSHTHQHVDVHDAAKRRDPTGTFRLRGRFRADLDKRWQRVIRQVMSAVGEHDLLGVARPSAIAGQDKVSTFSAWLESEINLAVLGGNGGWLAQYVQQACDTASRRANELTGVTTHQRRTRQLEQMAVSELKGVVAATQQQATRCVAHCLLSSAPASKIAREVAAVLRKVGRTRSRAMAEYLVVKAHAATTLDAFRQASVTHVGIEPERVSRDAIMDRGPMPSVPKGGREGPVSRSREETPSESTIYRAERAQRRLEAALGAGEVDTLTAGDDRVCEDCQDVADGGPYTLDEAESLIPQHPACRCALVPSGEGDREED